MESRADGQATDASAARRERTASASAAAVVIAAGLLALAAAAWQATGAVADEGPPLSEADGKAASDAVYLFNALSSHLREAGGDPRYAERVPASDEVVAEAMGEALFLREAGRSEQPRLARFEVNAVRSTGVERAEVRTKEYWMTKDRAGDVRADVVQVRYSLRREAGLWRVSDWDLELGDAARAPAAGSPEGR